MSPDAFAPGDPTVLYSLGVAIAGIAALIVGVLLRRRRHDPIRLFTVTQKRTLLARAGHRCEYKPPLWRRCRQTHQLEADHVVAWTRGGPTELWNGQILCHRHNQVKAARPITPLYRWRLERRRRRYTSR